MPLQGPQKKPKEPRRKPRNEMDKTQKPAKARAMNDLTQHIPKVSDAEFVVFTSNDIIMCVACFDLVGSARRFVHECTPGV